MSFASSFRSSINTTQTSQRSTTIPSASRNMSGSSVASSRKTNTNNDFSDINAQIDTVEFTMTNLNSEMKQKSALFETEMENIQNQIKIAKESFEYELEQQRREQDDEVAEIKQQHAEEIHALESSLRKAMSRKENFTSSRNQVRRIQKESELADLNHQLELMRIQQDDQTYLFSTSTSRMQSEYKQKEAELSAQIEMLDAEINDVTATRKEEMLQFKMKLEEATQSFEKRNHEQQLKISRYQGEVAKRHKECEEHISAIRNQAEMEQAQLENEMTTTNEKLKGLNLLYTKLQNRYSQEIQTVLQDIDTLKSAIEKAKQRETEQIEETRQQIAKLRGAQHDSIAIEQEILSLKQEIEEMRKENQDMRKERNRVETISYTTRISKFRSSSIH